MELHSCCRSRLLLLFGSVNECMYCPESQVLNFPAETEPVTEWCFFFLPSLFSPVDVSRKMNLCFTQHRIHILPQAVMKLNHNVNENKHVARLCSFVISQMGQGVPLVVVVLQCCMMFAGVTRTARMSL